MRFLRVLLGAILLLALAVFAVANRAPVAVSLDPLPYAVELPLYLLVFVSFLIGLGLGGLLLWLGGLRRKPKPPPGAQPPAVI